MRPAEAVLRQRAESPDKAFEPERPSMKLIPTLMLSAALLLGAGEALAAPQFLAGTYSADGHKGMSLLKFDAASDSFTTVRTFEAVENASFALYDAKSGRLYVTDEIESAGFVGGYVLSKDLKTLKPLGVQPSGAGAPCYLALSPDKSRLAVANYFGDLVAVFHLDPKTGAIQPGPQALHAAGEPKAAFDAGHAHWVQWSPEGDRIYVSDLGHDEIRAYAYDAKTGAVGAPTTAAKLPQGSGPRHLAFAPKGAFAYVVTEFGSTVTAFARQPDGTLKTLQTVPTLPADFAGKNQAAHLAINAAGDVLYMSNRGHNSIASFRIAEDGTLTALQTIPTGGDWPRFFLLDEADQRLFVAHQRSNDIAVFHVETDGRLTATGKKFEMSRPVMLVPVGR
jgi:6-phosphogluconolactonase